MYPTIRDLTDMVPIRSAEPIAALGPLFPRLSIEPWMDKVKARAEKDAMPLHGWPEADALELIFGGGPLEDARVQQALLYAVPWAELTNPIFGGLPVWTEWFGELRDARQIPADQDKAWSLLAEAGFPDGKDLPEIAVIAPEGDGRLRALVERVSGILSEAGLRAVPMPLPSDYAREKATALMEIGQPVLWLNLR
jgi:ABC-type transport system substrate-binding protein